MKITAIRQKLYDLPGPTIKGRFSITLPGWVSAILTSLKGIVKGFFAVLKAAIYGVFYYLRNHPIHALFNAVIFVAVSSLVITGAEMHQRLILSKISNDTVANIIAGSDFSRQYDIDGMRKNGVREFVAVGGPSWTQSEGIKAILFEARKARLSIEDQAVLLAIANIESGFNPAAQAGTTTACGLFQFVEKTGLQFNLTPSECMNPSANAKAGIKHYLSNFDQSVKNKVENLTGVERVFRTFELSYYLHHDGPNSSNPSNEVKAIVLNGSQFLFKAYHTLQDEAESHKSAPGFGDAFVENFIEILHSVKESVIA